MILPLAPSWRHRDRGATPARPTGNRRGFTLVEAIIAIVLLAVGILAMASSSSVIIRDMSGASQRAKAAARATEKIEALRARDSCAGVGAAAMATPGMDTATAGPSGGSSALRVRYVVQYKVNRTARTDTFTTAIPCTRP